MTASEPQPAAPYPKLRWYQWRLRSLFILTLLVAIGMSWLTVTMRDQRRQKVAAEAIRKAGGWVRAETTWLGKLLGDDSLVKVTDVRFDAYRTTDVDTQLQNLRGLSELRELGLNWTDVTDAGLAHLQGCTHLRRLWLKGTKVTNAGLAHLQGCTRLRRLYLNDTKVTDVGLVHLQAHTQLQKLDLAGTQVTDVGLAFLQGLPQSMNWTSTRPRSPTPGCRVSGNQPTHNGCCPFPNV